MHIPARKKPLPQEGQRRAVLWLFHIVNCRADALRMCRRQKLPRRFAGGLVLLRRGVQCAAGQKYLYRRTTCKKLRENFTLDPVKIRKAVKIEGLVLRKITRFQRGKQAVQARFRVLSAVGADAGVALHQKSEFLHLDRKHTGQLLTGAAKIGWGHAITAKFLQRVDQPKEKFRFHRAASEDLQAGAHLLHRKGHHQQAAARVGFAVRCAAFDGKHAAGQPGKAQNLRKAADGIPAAQAELALRGVGKLLRRD